jgi:predicted nucleotidyltransferase
MTVQEAVLEHREEILRIWARHGATNVRVFGSVARGTTGPESDLDLLIDAGPDTSPWFPAGLMTDLENLLGCQIDVATEKTLHRRIRDRVLAEARPLYRISDGSPRSEG